MKNVIHVNFKKKSKVRFLKRYLKERRKFQAAAVLTALAIKILALFITLVLLSTIR